MSASAQNIKLTVQTGHSAPISDMLYTPDGNYIITAGEDNKIIIWDVFTSKQFAALLGHRSVVTSISLHPNGKMLLSTSKDSTIRLWNLETERTEQTLKLDEPLYSVAFHPNGKEFLIGGEELYRYSYPELIPKKVGLNAQHGLTAMKWSNSGRYFAVGGAEEKKAYLFNDTLGRIQQEYLAKVTDFDFTADESFLFYTTTEGHVVQRGIDEKVRNSSTTDWMLNSINSVELTDSLILVANDIGEINIIDLNNWMNHRVFINSRQKISSISLSPDKKFLALAGDNRAVLIWDMEKRRAVKILKGLVNRINDIAFSTDGEDIIVGYADGEVRKTNLISNVSVLNHLKPSGRTILDRGEYSVSKITAIEGDTVRMKVFYTRRSLEHEGLFDKVQEHDVIWDMNDNYLNISEKIKSSEFVHEYVKDAKEGVYRDGKSLLKTELLFANSEKKNISAQVVGNDIIVKSYDLKTDKFTIETGHSDLISSIAINERYGFLASASWDGMIRFWDLNTGDLLTIFGAFGRGQYVYLNEDNYYFASKYALDYIGFKFDDKLYSFDQFDLKYNRPDLIVEKLPYFDEEYKEAYFKAYKKRLSKMGVEEADLELTKNIPSIVVERIDVNGGKRKGKFSKDTEINFRVKASDEGSHLDKLHVKVNGVPEFGILGKTIEGHEFSEEITLKLTPGQNYVQFNVVNVQGVSSFISSFNLQVKDNEAVSNLYVITIGASKFSQSQYNLNYAEKDASDIASFFEKNHKGYDQCYVRKLVNDQITKENVRDLKNFLKDAKENDVVIFFVAGHGVLDEQLDYYFSTFDMDFDHPSERGISYDIFEDLMADTKSRKKVMFIDACHSGEIDKDEVIENFVLEEQGDLIFRGLDRSVKNIEAINSFDLSKTLFADMRMNSGTTVISSAGGAEYAIEGDEWKNSVFTYTLLSGLKEGLADLNKDKEVRLSELQEFVLFEVSRLTNGMQTPTSRAENLKNDFVIQ